MKAGTDYKRAKERAQANASRDGGRTVRVRITINCDNAAFGDAPVFEVARILNRYAALIENDRNLPLGALRLKDHNGNTVGKVEVSES